MKSRETVVNVVVIAAVVACVLFSGYFGIDRRVVAAVGFGAHVAYLGLRSYEQYQRGVELKNLSEALRNYRCPLCNYFVDADASQCPKCRRPIMPKAD